jgi:hypothetical protein
MLQVLIEILDLDQVPEHSPIILELMYQEANGNTVVLTVLILYLFFQAAKNYLKGFHLAGIVDVVHH